MKMINKQLIEKIKLDKIEVEAIFDPAVFKSIIPKEIATKTGRFTELEEELKYELPIPKRGKVRIIGYCSAIPEVAGCTVLTSTFEVSDEVKEVIIGKQHLNEWNIIFTPQGPRIKGKVKLGFTELEAIFDTTIWPSVMSKKLAMEIGHYWELEDKHKYDLQITQGRKVRIIGHCTAIPEIAGCRLIPADFVVSDEVEGLTIGKGHIIQWDLIFTPEGPRVNRYSPPEII